MRNFPQLKIEFYIYLFLRSILRHKSYTEENKNVKNADRRGIPAREQKKMKWKRIFLSEL